MLQLKRAGDLGGRHDTGSLKRSVDLGVSWKVIDFGVPQPAAVVALAVHPKDSNLVFVGTSSAGLHRTSDGGKTWSKVESGLQKSGGIRAIALDPDKAKRLFVAAAIKGSGDVSSVYLSEDGGESFEDVGAELPWEEINALALDPGDSKTLYVGTSFSGVFVTHDAGASWNEASRGLPLGGRTVNAIATSGSTLFAATFGAIHRRRRYHLAAVEVGLREGSADRPARRHEQPASLRGGWREERDDPEKPRRGSDLEQAEQRHVREVSGC